MKGRGKKKKHTLSLIQILVLSMIGLCFVIVVGFLIFSLMNKPENRIKSMISDLASDYYENYLYADFGKSDAFIADPAGVMKKYEEVGFSSVTLRQLILHEREKNADIAGELRKYCNENNTTVKFFPEPPFGDKNYRINYTYSCDF